jgi:NAD(P)-dependent dehydrogenase (short-subunit alcohol dehydrogenase family)
MNTEFFASKRGVEEIQSKMLAKRLGEMEELDGALLLLASEQSSFMNGSIVTVDGGHLVGSL